MTQSSQGGTVHARILYWGIQGAGLSSNLHFIHAKLRTDHRGDLRHEATRLDPTVTYEVLPISLGEVSGVATQLQITAVPTDPAQGPTRKQLLDEVDGVVLVVDSQMQRASENKVSVEELRKSLEAYGRSLDEIPLVVQYNKRDLTEDYQVEALHRELGLPSHAVFEAMADQGKGVLKTLTTISKQVVRSLRDRRSEEADALGEPVAVYDREALEQRAAKDEPAPAAAAPTPGIEKTQRVSPVADPIGAKAPPSRTPLPPAASKDLLEEAILAEADQVDEAEASEAAALAAQTTLDRPWEALASDAKPPPDLEVALEPALQIVSVGTATRNGPRSVRLPLVLGDPAGRTLSVVLTLGLETLLDDA